MDGRVSVENRIDGRLCVYRVKDGQSRHVVVWNRNGRISVECECTSEEMGCRHCACVYMSLLSDQGDDRKFIDDVRRSIEELSDISFNPLDYLGETTEKTIMTRFYDFIQKKIDRKIACLCGSIGEVPDEEERERLYRLLWHATARFESPHDEWSKDSIISKGGKEYSEDEG